MNRARFIEQHTKQAKEETLRHVLREKRNRAELKLHGNARFLEYIKCYIHMSRTNIYTKVK